MKRLIPTLLVTLVAAVAPAQVSITKIKNFGAWSNATGVSPRSPLLRGPDGTLYGATGGADGLVNGTLFKLQPDGSGFTIVKAFTNTNATEGAGPVGQLAISGNTIYGNSGKVFKVNTDGTGYTVLKDVTNPSAGVVLSGDTLYGWGFKIKTDGTGYTQLAGFPSVETYGETVGLIVSGGELYGTTMEDGLYGAGTVFKVNTDGTGYTVLFNIAAADKPVFNVELTLAGNTLYGVIGGNIVKINTDGTGYAVLKDGSSIAEGIYNPGLTHSGGVLYGSMGYPIGVGVFSINTDGTGFQVIKNSNASDGAGIVWWWTVSSNALYGVSRFSYQSAGRQGTLSKLNTDGSGFQVLKQFTFSEAAAYPSRLVYSAGTLYGTTPLPGLNFLRTDATIFKINTDGTGYTLLRQVPADNSVPWPYGRLTASGSTLYGTATGRGYVDGGDNSHGTVFRMNTDGTGYSVLKEFIWPADGDTPLGGLALSGSTLYGAAQGSIGGKVFKLNTDGTGYTVLHQWTNTSEVRFDGELTVKDNTIYGTAYGGGQFGAGTLSKLNTDGTGSTVLKHFRYPQWDTNSLSYIYNDGAVPAPNLVLANNTLYGVTREGGQITGGTLFKMNTDGTGFMVVKQFPDTNWVSAFPTNSDGTAPAGLALSGVTLYGTTHRGGHHGGGTLFKVNLDGTGFTVLEHFTRLDLGGSGSLEGLIPGENSLYGTGAGDLRLGAIFRIDFAPILSIGRTMSGDVAVSWPSVWTDFALQQNAYGLSSLNWSNVTDTIQDDGTKKSVSFNPSPGARFYRLFKP